MSEVNTVPAPANQKIRELNSLAVKGLSSMFDPKQRLFCRTLRRTASGFIREGLSHRDTTIALLGLHTLQKAGAGCPFELDALFESCTGDLRWICGVGDLGLVTWLTAEYAPHRLDTLFQSFDLESCLDRLPDAREARTMELAWFLTGLCAAKVATPGGDWPLGELAVETYHRLEDNRGEYGLFGHLGRDRSWTGRFRGRIGNFADQIYPIYAMTRFSTAFDLQEPLESAMECGAALCRLQGDYGQWWRFYDASTGRVVCRYPVYSVDQHGMAPLALFALEERTGQRFQDSIYRGLDWICGSNELGEDLRSFSRGLIWGCVAPRNRGKKYWETAIGLMWPSKEHIRTDSLEVHHETRPYELGLLLCSFAKFGTADSNDGGPRFSLAPAMNRT